MLRLIVFLKQYFIGCFSIIRSICLVAAHMFNKRETHMYPDSPYIPFPRYRGRIVLTRSLDGNERCVACNLCSVACPVGCIALQKGEFSNGRWYAKFFRINFSRCIFCGMCEEACPTRAIQLIPDFEMSDFQRSDLIYEKEDLLISGPGKYSEYDFYKMSGVSIEGKGKGMGENEVKPISVKNIMPLIFMYLLIIQDII